MKRLLPIVLLVAGLSLLVGALLLVVLPQPQTYGATCDPSSGPTPPWCPGNFGGLNPQQKEEACEDMCDYMCSAHGCANSSVNETTGMCYYDCIYLP